MPLTGQETWTIDSLEVIIDLHKSNFNSGGDDILFRGSSGAGHDANNRQLYLGRANVDRSFRMFCS